MASTGARSVTTRSDRGSRQRTEHVVDGDSGHAVLKVLAFELAWPEVSVVRVAGRARPCLVKNGGACLARGRRRPDSRIGRAEERDHALVRGRHDGGSDVRKPRVDADEG